MSRGDAPPRQSQKKRRTDGGQSAAPSVSDRVGQSALNSPLNVRILLMLAHHEGARQFISAKCGCIGTCPLHVHHQPLRQPMSRLGLADVRVPAGERLAAIGGGLTALLSLSFSSRGACASAPKVSRQISSAIYRRVTRARASAVIEREFQEAQRVRAACDFAAAAARYSQLSALGHGASHAELAWILIDGREGVKPDAAAGFRAALLGSQLGCMHSRGVLSYCHVYSYAFSADVELGYRLARESAAAGSKFGLLMLGAMHLDGRGGAARDVGRALLLYQSAAALGLDAAQFRLGRLHQTGQYIRQDAAEALRWFLLAACQGHPWSCHEVADHYLEGLGAPASREEAARWYERAVAGGLDDSRLVLRRLGRGCGCELDGLEEEEEEEEEDEDEDEEEEEDEEDEVDDDDDDDDNDDCSRHIGDGGEGEDANIGRDAPSHIVGAGGAG